MKTASVLAALVAGAAVAQSPTLFPITDVTSPQSVDPRFGPATISTTVASGVVSQVAQIELRPIGTTGVYNVACTVLLPASPGRPQLLTGTLDLGTAPAVWTPSDAVDALNGQNPGVVPSTFVSFQLSMSPDQLVVVWDNYTGVSAGVSWPTAPPAPTRAHTLVCKRPSPGVPFRTGAALPVVGFTNIWSDSHIGPVLSNGRYEYFFSDIATGGPGNIVRAELDPTTGQVFGPGGAPAPVTVRSKTPGTAWAHSPFDMRDSNGKVRALSFGQIMNSTTTSPSSMFWAPNVNDTGTPYVLGDGFAYPLPPPPPPSGSGWFSNGSANGGTLVYGLASVPSFQQLHPQIVEHTLIADTDLIAGEPIAGWAPIRPLGPAPVPPSFLSMVAVSFSGLLPTPIPVPPLLGTLCVNPTGLILLGLALHDPFTGYAEWVVPAPSPPLLQSVPMQIVTFDLSAGNIYLGNVAQLSF